MAYSLGLTLYNLAARRETTVPGERPPRPAGQLIWLHVPSTESLRPMRELARRLCDEDGYGVLMTAVDGVDVPQGVIMQPPPADTTAAAAAFLDHWRPDAIIVADGELRPIVMDLAHDRGIAIAIVNGRAPFILREREGWWPGLMRGILGNVARIFVVDDAAARAFRKAGGAAERIEVAGRMEEGTAALPCNEAERAAVNRLLAARPVWLAVGLPEAEEAMVAAAHISAMRLAHRLLLIIVPEQCERGLALAARLDAMGLAVARRSAEEEPDPETEVYVADVPNEFGLWYRLAPITFLGGSLAGKGALRDPLEAAALGSAILHGPRPGAYGAMFGRLGAARGAWSVASAVDLAEAVSDLLSPDRTARLAQAAWTISSDGVEVTERVVDMIRHMLGDDA